MSAMVVMHGPCNESGSSSGSEWGGSRAGDRTALHNARRGSLEGLLPAEQPSRSRRGVRRVIGRSSRASQRSRLPFASSARLLESTLAIVLQAGALWKLGPRFSARRASPAPSLRMASSSSKPPLVAVVGTTGVGKSLLGVELARALSQGDSSTGIKRGEVINTDSMQVYRGLDVITNKATLEEMNGVKHHLMGFLSPGEEYRVGEFQADALAKVRTNSRRSSCSSLTFLRADRRA